MLLLSYVCSYAGLGGLDAVFAEFKCVEESGEFLLHLGPHAKLELSYSDHDVHKNLHSEALVVSTASVLEQDR